MADMSLESMIALERKNNGPAGGRRGGKRGAGRGGAPARVARGGGRGAQRTGGGRVQRRASLSMTTPKGRPDIEKKWKHDMFNTAPPQPAQHFADLRGIIGNEAQGILFVSNLHVNVSDSDLLELFSRIGKVKRVNVHYDQTGRSLGEATVVFERRSEALIALQQYNGVPLDGVAMNIVVQGDGAPQHEKAPALPRLQRGSKAAQRQAAPRRVVARGAARTKPRAVRQGAGRQGGRNNNNSRKQVTAAMLDEELDNYMK